MRFGICSNLRNIEVAQKVGFDYMESVLRTLYTMPMETFLEYRHIVDSLHFYVESFNGFYDKQKIVGFETTPKADLIEYTNRTLERAKHLGGKIVVYGSSKAREMPEDFSYESAKNQFLEAFTLTAEIAAQYEISVVLEPLQFKETNFINRVSEGLQIVKETNHPNAKLMADLYHMVGVGEDNESILLAGENIRHIHLAEPTKRIIPTTEDEFDYTPFASALKKIGYTERVSIECAVDNTKLEEQFQLGLALQRKIF